MYCQHRYKLDCWKIKRQELTHASRGISWGYLFCNWGVFDGFCISSAIHTHSSNTYARPERRRREDGRKKKQQLDHPPHCNSLILCFGSFMCSLSKSFLCSNLFIWLDRPVVPIGSRCYISILDGLVIICLSNGTGVNSCFVFSLGSAGAENILDIYSED